MSGKKNRWKSREELKEGLRRMSWQSDRSAQRQGSCPDEALLAAYADGLLEEEERRQAEEHFADCDACLGQIGLLVQLSRPGLGLRPLPDELAAKARSLADPPARRWPVGYWMPAAAAALLLLAIAPWVAIQVRDASPPERLLRSSQGTIKLQVVAPQPESALSLPFEIAWKPVQKAVSYRVLVVTSEGEPVWQGQTTRAQITLPADPLLHPGANYFFRVNARIPGGSEVYSPYVGFAIRKDQ